MLRSELDKVLELHEIWLSGYVGGIQANLSGMDLSGIDLSGVDLTEAILLGTNFTNARMDRVCLNSAIANGANFTRASMREAKLIDGHFEQSVFFETDLSYAKLSCSNFTGAFTDGAKLHYVQKRAAIGLPEDMAYKEIFINASFTVKVMAPDCKTAKECLEHELRDGCFKFSKIEDIYDIQMTGG